MAPLRAKAKAEREAKEQAQQEAKVAREAAFQKARQEEFDKLYRGPAELAYLATGGTREGFAKLWEERLREEIRVEAMTREIGRRQATAAKHVREAMSR